MYMMGYLKGFNEGNITDEFLSELKDFCEMNLVYLMDDGLQVSCVKHPIYNVRDISMPGDNFDFDSHLSCVTLRYPLAPGTFELLVQKDWNDIKDVIIPFFTRLSREYNVITFDQLSIAKTASLLGKVNNSQVQFGLRRTTVVNPGLTSGGFRKNFTVDDVITDRLDLGTNLIVEIKFYVSCNDEVVPVKKKSIGSRVKDFLGFNESVGNLQDELDDVCDTCLSPLVDDGFTYEVTSTWNGEFEIRLSKLESNVLDRSGGIIPELYDYTDVMDRFIPLVRMLSRRYDMSEWIYFYTTEEWDINKKVFSVDQICDDEKPGFLVTRIKLTVKGRKG